MRIVSGTSPTPTPTPTPNPTPCSTPQPSGKTAHAYFETLANHSEHLCNWSLRNQAQLDHLTADDVAKVWSYNPSGDTYANKQDAAKLLIPAGLATSSISTYQQLRMPVPQIGGGSLLITWDWFWGPEFLSNRGGMNHYKVFHVIMGGHALWTLMHSPAWASGGDIGKIWDSMQTAGTYPAGLIRREPFTPSGEGAPDQRSGSGEQIGIQANTWMRYWLEIKMFQPPSAFVEWNRVTGTTLQANGSDPQGRWHMASLWFADEKRNVQRVLYRVPVSWNSLWDPNISRFDFEMNTSQNTGFIGPWIGYGRNVVLLRNYKLPSVPETDSFIFQRPLR